MATTFKFGQFGISGKDGKRRMRCGNPAYYAPASRERRGMKRLVNASEPPRHDMCPEMIEACGQSFAAPTPSNCILFISSCTGMGYLPVKQPLQKVPASA